MATRRDAEILSLPIDEQLALVDTIWESIRDNADDLPVGDETIAEMEFRLDLRSGPPGDRPTRVQTHDRLLDMITETSGPAQPCPHQ